MCSLQTAVYKSFYAHVFRNNNLGPESGHLQERHRKAPEGTFVSQHAIFWETQAPNSAPSRQRMHMPSRYTGDKEKLTATRQKFMQSSTTVSDTSSTSRQKSNNSAEFTAKPIVRGRTDFNQLLQKFSGSESNSEKSDNDVDSFGVNGIPRRRSLVKRQEAKEVFSSSEESDTRRTPDRTQSLKLHSRFGGISHKKDATSTNTPEIHMAAKSINTQEVHPAATSTKTPEIHPAVTSTKTPEIHPAVTSTKTSEIHPAATSTNKPEVHFTAGKSSSFRSEFMNRKWLQRGDEFSQNLKESSQNIKESTPLQTTTFSTTKSTHASSLETKSTSSQSSRLSHQPSDVYCKSEALSSQQTKTQHLKGLSTSVSTEYTPSSSKAQLNKTTSRDDTPGNSVQLCDTFIANEPIALNEKSSDKTRISGETSVNKITNFGKTSMDKITSEAETSLYNAANLGEKEASKRTTVDMILNRATSLGERSKPAATNVGDVLKVLNMKQNRSLDEAVSHNAKPMNTDTNLLETSMSKTTNLLEKSVDKTLNATEKSVDKTLNATEKSVDKTLNATEKSVDKTLNATEKSVDKCTNLHDMSTDKATNLQEKSLQKATKLREKYPDKIAEHIENPLDKTTDVREKSVEKTINPHEKIVDETKNIHKTYTQKTINHDVQHVEKTSNLTVNLHSCSQQLNNAHIDSATHNSQMKSFEMSDDVKLDEHKEYPQAKPRTSLRRDTKSEIDLPETTLSSSTSSTNFILSALSSSISSSEIKSLTVSTETILSNTSDLRRTSSVREVATKDAIDKRKGILKRNTSLTKQDVGNHSSAVSYPTIDPQLAKILKQRKQMIGDVSNKGEVEEEDMDGLCNRVHKTKVLTPAEEIDETIRYSKQIAAERGRNPDDDEGLKRLSVADRIYSMQAKIEEDNFAVVTPKSRSGLSTPRSRQRSGVITPTNTHKSHDDTPPSTSMSSSVTTAADTTVIPNTDDVAATSMSEERQSSMGLSSVSSTQLMEKLNKIANNTENYEKKRNRFQHRSRKDWRYQTQPVTYDEIQAADSLETVSAFRALVRKQASINAFDQVKVQTSIATKQQLSSGGKKTEFPQHLAPPPKLQRRSRKCRHRTLPVTAEELNAVPEHQMLVTDPDWVKFDEFDLRDSKTDSGILSGSDADSLFRSESLRTLSLDMDLSECDPSRMSVSDKASMFKVLEDKTKAERDKEKSASGAKRYINRKKRERSQTTPITEEEMKSASEIGGERTCGISEANRPTKVSLPQPEVVNRSRSASITEDEDINNGDDELVKLSITEKVKLFSQQREAEKPPAKNEVPVVRRRSRKVASRFNTQPVTNEEVEKAAEFTRISPLAMSMVKPPDPEILKGLPLKDQRELMAQHAEMFLSQTSLRSRSGSNASQSQPSSRRASVTLDSEEVNIKQGSDESDINDKKLKPGILKDKSASAKDLHDVKSILKTDPFKAKSESEVHSILKMEVKNVLETSFALPEPRGILKKTKSEDIGGLEYGEDMKGILKHTDNEEEENQIRPRSRSNSQPSGILKLDNNYQPIDHSLEIRSILKSPSQENVHDLSVMKSAMRRGSIESDTSVAAPTNILKSALRVRNKNSVESDENCLEEIAPSDRKSTCLDSDQNLNNSYKRATQTVSTSTEHVDHLSNITISKYLSSATTINQSLEGMQSVSSAMSKIITSKHDSLQIPECCEEKSGQSASDGESSCGEILDDTPRTSKLKRKSRFTDKSATNERYKTQPLELTEAASTTLPSGESVPRQKYKYEGRHRTQPITPNEMREAEAITPAGELTRTPGGSIADRLNQLKSSGEEEWKKRVGKKEDLLATNPDLVKFREKTGVADSRPFSIADRLSELETSMTTWKERVEESDAKQFTVAGKLVHGPAESPLYSKLKNLPRKDDSGSKNSSPLSSPVTPTKEFIAKIPFPKDIVQDTSVIVENLKTPASRDGLAENEEKKTPVKVEIPSMGEEIENFFAVKQIEEITDTVEMEIDDFNNIFIESEMILSTVRKVRPNRNIKHSSHNPLKTMSQKIEIKQEYTEVIQGTAERELKRVKKEALAKDAGFAQAALAGLASKENFKQVELRRTDSGSSVHGQVLDPFKEIMLLHVKGRRLVQTRLVEPTTRSINEGDCYILVTGDKVIHWEGRFANVIEKAKASEVANYIQQKKDLGCKKSNEVLTVSQDRDQLGAGKLFWSALEGEKQFQACGPDAEDELYESSIVKCNMVYRLVGNALQPYEEYWGSIPKYEMLKKNEVIVFDFGTEFYIWQGKAVSMEQRKLGLKLSKQLYDKGYDYTESLINPLSPLRTEDSGGLPLSSTTRPNWAIFGKVNQNMETILFREKFADWPDSSRLIGCKGHGPSETINKELLEMKSFDAKKMIPISTTPVNLKLEGANLGRGVKWSEDMQGFIKEQDIVTLDVIAWHVLEYAHYKLSNLSHGQFHDGDTYVVRWQYMIANANLRSLKGSAARNSLTGRERCAYFFWQGNQSTINEKGASALMTVELDEERGPQVRVLQGKEPPAFLNLFGGKMIVHIGKREDPTTNSQGHWRMYCLRGDYDNEASLLEVPVCVKHLRSRSSLVLLNVKTGIVYIWHGSKSPKHVRELCLKTVNKLKEKTPLEVGLHESATITVIEVEEGQEKQEIWTALDRSDRSIYHSLLTDPLFYNYTIRLFHMSSVNMMFEVHEQLNPAHVSDLVSPFPFLQSDLYKATQPALYLIDNELEVYLWQGWWPVGSNDTENVQTGSAIARFNIDRRLAMETTLQYCREKNERSSPTAYLVCAGVEPVCFTSLFPFWEDDIIVKNAAIEEGKTAGYMEPVSDILHRLTKTRYTLAELQERPLPEGVDPLKLETFLFDADFEEILDMTREDFYAQPHWKQIDIKKHAGLF